jgi:hypothetical protein
VPPGNLATNPTPLTNPLIPAGHIATDDEPPVVIGVVVDHLLKVYTFDDMIFIFPGSHRVKVRFVAASPRWEVASERGTTGWRQMAAETREGDSSEIGREMAAATRDAMAATNERRWRQG